MDNSKTFRLDSTQPKIMDDFPLSSSIDPLYMKQKEDVATMRASLLSCNLYNPGSAKAAIQNITVMRVYHQISRIIRYTELMDKLEDKLYESIEHSLDTMDSSNPTTWISLLGIQEKLQKAMIESHKLIQPYLDLEDLNLVPVVIDEPDNDSFASNMLDKESREKIRTGAQLVLTSLTKSNGGKSNE